MDKPSSDDKKGRLAYSKKVLGLWGLVEPNDCAAQSPGVETRTDTAGTSAASTPVRYGRAKKEIQIDGHGASCRMSEQRAGCFLFVCLLFSSSLGGPVAAHIWPEKRH